jgi:RIO kinase 1
MSSSAKNWRWRFTPCSSNQVVRMLCAGIIHGDLSEYNILVGEDGPVIIDVPQAIDAAGNSNAAEMFARDVINLRTYFSVLRPRSRAASTARKSGRTTKVAC